MNATHMTTVEANEVQRYLARIRDAGGKHAVVEASSIGLDMHRVDQCEFDVGVFTNLSPDHLDYHDGMEEYRDAKAILFRMLNETADKGFGKAAVLNADDAASEYFRTLTTRARRSRTASSDKADITRARRPHGRLRHLVHRRGCSARTCRRESPLIGDYNVANCIAAVAAAVVAGRRVRRRRCSALESFPGVPGRMELIDEGQPFRVVVDIASTEQAMRNVLRMLRPVTPGKLIVVFGAAGERDAARRRTIARAVAELADYAVITNEDPRSEDARRHPRRDRERVQGARASAGTTASSTAGRRSSCAFKRRGAGRHRAARRQGHRAVDRHRHTHWPWDERRIAREVLRDLGACR